jgi:uncharacterized damage-inducible protein DinB
MAKKSALRRSGKSKSAVKKPARKAAARSTRAAAKPPARAKKGLKKAATARTTAMAKKTPAQTPAAPSAKQQFLSAFAREHATTMRVLRAFPAEHAEMQPHERSNSARKLMWTFAVEQAMALKALDGTLMNPPAPFPAMPDSIDAVISAYEDAARVVQQAVADTPDDRLLSGTAIFFTGPKQLGPVPLMDLLWFLLFDKVHHRGQLSVYVRMAGGKVPSIYGPSADEPWN